MIQRMFTENFKLTPQEIESELWEMDTIEQAGFLIYLVKRFDRSFSDVCMQLEYLKEEKDKVLTDIEKRRLKDSLKVILEYLG